MKIKFSFLLVLFIIGACSEDNIDQIASKEVDVNITSAKNSLSIIIPKGIISTGSRGNPIPQQIIDNPIVDGFMIIEAWKEIQLSENDFNWNFIDSEVDRAIEANKIVRIAIHTGGESVPDWVIQNHPEIKKILNYDKKTSQPRYDPAYWNETFIDIKSNFLKTIADRYHDKKEVFAISASMVDPNTGDWLFKIEDEVQKQSYLDAGFTESVFIDAYKKLLDNMLSHTKDKIVITAVGPLPHQLVTDKYAALYEVINYAHNTYGNRLIIAKGSLQAKTPNPNNTIDLLTWQVMWDFKPQCAGQFVWSVSNDPEFKMNGGEPYTDKNTILSNAFNIGFVYELNWIEIWKADLLNPALKDKIEEARNILIGQTTSIND